MQKNNGTKQQIELTKLLTEYPDLELAVLVGSQATGTSNSNSDWDIAIRWVRNIDPLESLGKTETLRRILAMQLKQAETRIDLIDLTRANLPMKAVVAEEGIVLKGEDSLEWIYFLQRTWRELESFYWDKTYATRTLPS